MPDYNSLRPRTKWQGMPARALDGNDLLINFGAFVQPKSDPLRALVSVDLYELDGVMDGHWLHLSISRERRLPTWADLCTARDQLGYTDRLFVQLLPPASAWLNMHSYCLHLWSRLDAVTVPDAVWNQVGCDGERYGKKGALR